MTCCCCYWGWRAGECHGASCLESSSGAASFSSTSSPPPPPFLHYSCVRACDHCNLITRRRRRHCRSTRTKRRPRVCLARMGGLAGWWRCSCAPSSGPSSLASSQSSSTKSCVARTTRPAPPPSRGPGPSSPPRLSACTSCTARRQRIRDTSRRGRTPGPTSATTVRIRSVLHVAARESRRVAAPCRALLCLYCVTEAAWFQSKGGEEGRRSAAHPAGYVGWSPPLRLHVVLPPSSPRPAPLHP